MVVKALLDDLMESLECSASDMNAYYDRLTGNTIFLNDDYLRQAARRKSADDESKLANWEKECLAEARAIVNDNDDRYIPLPGSDDIHEWAIMNRFALNANSNLTDRLTRALKGGGAFRRFRETLDRHGLTDQWYSFRKAALREIAIAWCEENNIEYVQAACKETAS